MGTSALPVMSPPRIKTLAEKNFAALMNLIKQRYEIAALHRSMMERARRVIVLADHSKLGFRAPAVVAPVSLVTTLVTDDAASPDALEQLQARGVQVTSAGKQVSEREDQPETVM